MDQFIDAVKQGDTETVRALLSTDKCLVSERDPSGASALHYAALNGDRKMAELLIDSDAEVNLADSQFGATPAGWAIEHLRERGAYLAIELNDVEHAIQRHDAHWVARFLARFPGLRDATTTGGVPIRELATASGHPDIAALFEL